MGSPEGYADVLSAVVAGIGGEPRAGQLQMAEAVAQSLADGDHLLVQAGTGTGKSLAYLIPAVEHVRSGHDPVVVATATLALQHQLVSRDLPAVDAALRASGHDGVNFAVLKGRANYLCLQRLHDPTEAQLEIDPDAARAAGRLERQAARVREWAEHTDTGDRDDIADIDPRVWRAFSVSARECVGATKCAFGSECFPEQARARAGAADIVVTNHALLALHALESVPVLPEHSAVVVDEGHEFTERATSAVTVELSAASVTRATAGARRLLSRETLGVLEEAATTLADALFAVDGRLDPAPDSLRAALAAVRDASHAALTDLAGGDTTDPDVVARRARATAALSDVHDVAGEILGADEYAVVWVTRFGAAGTPVLYHAPLSVAAPIRDGLMADGPVVVTSATLSLGGDFGHVARDLGLESATVDTPARRWRALDVGSPFDFAKQGILYVAADLPRPGRDGPSAAALDRLLQLVSAAGGRTLALYSSWRGVEAAAERLEDWSGGEVIVQQRGDSVGSLVRRFADDPQSVLVGTMSLWQGVDVPGDACVLVVIDRIPFPRPDDPLVQARSKRVTEAGGNGFTAVSVPRAALLMAQGAGRLIRSSDDRGVVAVLDSRLHTAGYGAYIKRSMPPLWPTTDTETVLGALTRLAGEHRQQPACNGLR